MAASNILRGKGIKAAIHSAIKAAGDAGKAQTLNDGGGLSLLVQPSRAAWWRLRYWLSGRENRLGLGTYPEVSLKQARERRDQARRDLAAGRLRKWHRRRRLKRSAWRMPECRAPAPSSMWRASG